VQLFTFAFAFPSAQLELRLPQRTPRAILVV
jgi:hypothetical protein